jgi:hypothetical protein
MWKIIKKKNILSISAIGIVLMYGGFCTYRGGENFYIYLIWISLEILLLFEYNFKKVIIMILVSISFVGMLDSLSLIIIQILNILFALGLEQMTKNLLASLLTIVFFITVYFVVLKKEVVIYNGIRILDIIQIFSLVFLYSLILAIIWNKYLEARAETLNIKVYIIFLIITITAYYQLIILLKLQISNKKLLKKDHMNEYLLQLKEKQYLYLKNTEQETRKIRHDLKNHMFILSNLCEEGNLDKASEYINQIWGKIEHLSPKYHVNYSILDAILNQYAYLCKCNCIQLFIKGYFPTICEITSYDICTLFTNILQNAYEAVTACDKKLINMTIRFDDNCIYIKQENTYNGEIKVKNGKFISMKEDSINHGYGVENILECIHKYHGNWFYKKLESKDGEKMLLLQIMLYNKQFK